MYKKNATTIKQFLVSVALSLILVCNVNADDNSISPFFIISDEGISLDRFPLLKTGAKVDISDSYQTYSDGGARSSADPLLPCEASIPILMGPTFGISAFLSIYDLQAENSFDDNDISMYGSAYNVGWSYMYLIDGIVNSQQHILFSLNYESFEGETDSSNKYNIDLLNEDDDIIRTATSYQTELSYLNLDVIFQYKPVPHFGFLVYVGLSFGLNLDAQIKQSITIPEEGVFTTEANPVLNYNNEWQNIKNIYSFYFGSKIGFAYEIHFGRIFFMRFNVGYNNNFIGGASLSDSNFSGLHYHHLGCSIIFPL